MNEKKTLIFKEHPGTTKNCSFQKVNGGLCILCVLVEDCFELFTTSFFSNVFNHSRLTLNP